MQIITSERALEHSPEESLTTGNKGLDRGRLSPCLSLVFALDLFHTRVFLFVGQGIPTWWKILDRD